MPEIDRGPKRLVWARGRAVSEECPKSFVTAESMAMVEAFAAWKAGVAAVREPSAREAEAFAVMEEESRAEATHGVTNGK